MKRSRILLAILILALIPISLVGTLSAQESALLPLAEPGPYDVGWQMPTFQDASRENRELNIMILYPAIIPEGEEPGPRDFGLHDAEPDTSAAPYPLILFSPGGQGSVSLSREFTTHLASHGFVVVSIGHSCFEKPNCLTDRPLDILYVLDQLELVQTGLNEIIDTDVVGVTGHSSGAYTTVAVSGAQIDPEYFMGWYEKDRNRMSVSQGVWSPPWDEIVAYRAQFDPPLVEGELWPPFADDRIRAMLPMGPCYGPLFSERGLAAVSIPTLVIGATKDFGCPYEQNTVFVYERLGAEERYLLSLINEGHFFVDSRRSADFVHHWAVTFFGYYLQGQEDYAEYLTAEYVDQFENLVWGVYRED